MARADLHVHSKYSRHASEWFLKKLGANESYSEPDDVYRLAKAAGMRFVTLTDHNRIEGVLRLKEKYPQDVFTGMEATAYFPEDGCKVHVLVYGLDEKDYEEIERRRESVYELRDYLQARDLAHAVAHATYAVNDRLKREHLEKLLLLFDVFEGINGSRGQRSNLGWMEILRGLTPQHIETLVRRHEIEPASKDPWVKGLIAGSDDHVCRPGRNACTGVWAEELTEAAIWQALRLGRTVAATGVRPELSCEVNGAPMGRTRSCSRTAA
jgi:hypothetical protein